MLDRQYDIVQCLHTKTPFSNLHFLFKASLQPPFPSLNLSKIPYYYDNIFTLFNQCFLYVYKLFVYFSYIFYFINFIHKKEGRIVKFFSLPSFGLYSTFSEHSSDSTHRSIKNTGAGPYNPGDFPPSCKKTCPQVYSCRCAPVYL